MLLLGAFSSALAPEGKNDMAWEIGDAGFTIRLSSYVPDIIGAHIAEAVADVMAPSRLRMSDVGIWAVHPGGRAIVDGVQRELQLADSQLVASREVLRAYGNMSSATILFVLRHVLDHEADQGRTICALAFGPGLTIESAILTLVPARTPRILDPREMTKA